MALASENSRNTYIGDGTDHIFPYTFKVFKDADLRVVVRDTAGVETLLKKTTDYTVSGIGARAGGEITLVNQVEGQTDEFGNPFESPTQPWLDVEGELKTGYALVIRRQRDLVQETSVRNQGAFYPAIHEDAFDILTMNDQQQQDEINRSVRLSETFSAEDFNPVLPPELVGSKGRTIVSNLTGDGFDIGPTFEEILNAEAYSQEAKESKELAKDWASKTDGYIPDTEENSAKAYAIGGVDEGQPEGGDAKSWAQKTDGEVIEGEFSAKEYAIGQQTRGQSGGGSAKDWASYIEGPVDGLYYSARYYAEQAASAESITISKETEIANGQEAWENLTDFSLDAKLFTSAEFILEIHRFTDSDHNFANGKIYLQRVNGLWRLLNGPFIGDAECSPIGDGVMFRVVESEGVGQIQYRSSIVPGANYHGKIKFRRIAFNVQP